MTIESQISELLSQAQFSHKNMKVERCLGGGNNRTYRVETEAGIFAVKQYFSHPDDPRDRLGAEFTFLTYAHQVAHGMVPKPIALIPKQNMALYEFIEGEKVRQEKLRRGKSIRRLSFFAD